MSPTAYTVLRRHVVLLLFTSVCTALVAGLVLLTVPRQSTSTTVLRLDTQGPLVGGGRPEATEYVERLQNTFTGLMESVAFRTQLDEAVGGPDRVRTSLDLTPNSEIMQVVAESTDPTLAVRAADVGARLLVQELQRQQSERVVALQRAFDADTARVRKEQAALRQSLAELPGNDVEARTEAQRQLDARSEDLDQLRQSYVDARGSLLGRLSVPVIVSPASAATTESGALRVAAVVAGGLLGLLAGAATALLLDRARRTFASGGEAARALGLPLMAELGCRGARALEGTDALGLQAGAAPDDEEVQEAARIVLAKLPAVNGVRGAVAVLTEPADPLHALLVARIAATAAAFGGDVVLVDADGSGSVLGDVLASADQPGLIEVVDGTMELDDVLLRSGAPNLSVLPRGGVDGNHALLAQSMLQAVVRDLTARGCFVLVSRRSAPDSEVLAWAGVVDGIVLALCPGRTRRSRATALTSLLAGVGAPIVGVVSVAPSSRRRLTRRRRRAPWFASSAVAARDWGLSA